MKPLYCTYDITVDENANGDGAADDYAADDYAADDETAVRKKITLAAESTVPRYW